jgi:hypothetical protein
MFKLRSKLVSLLAQASVFCLHQKTLAYIKICQFSVNYESIMFYDYRPLVPFAGFKPMILGR